eukprot:9892428-Prorocentrum_lima.AAC.1
MGDSAKKKLTLEHLKALEARSLAVPEPVTITAERQLLQWRCVGADADICILAKQENSHAAPK